MHLRIGLVRLGIDPRDAIFFYNFDDDPGFGVFVLAKEHLAGVGLGKRRFKIILTFWLVEEALLPENLPVPLLGVYLVFEEDRMLDGG